MTDLLKSLKSGASVPMPLSPQLVGRRERKGYLNPRQTPKEVMFCLGVVYRAMHKNKVSPLARTRCEALALALASESAKLSNIEFEELCAGLVPALTEGREAELRTKG